MMIAFWFILVEWWDTYAVEEITTIIIIIIIKNRCVYYVYYVQSESRVCHAKKKKKRKKELPSAANLTVANASYVLDMTATRPTRLDTVAYFFSFMYE